MSKRSIGVLSLIIIILGLLFALNYKKIAALFTPTKLQSEQTITTTKNQYDFENKIIQENTNDYSIDVKYPYYNNVQLDTYIKNLIDPYIKDTKKEKEDPVFTENMLNVDYKIIFAENELISIRFNIQQYASGAAHPNGIITGINYDLKNNKIIKLAEFFIDNNYLTQLSTASRKTLAQMDDISTEPDWIEQGTAPEIDNFLHFTFDKKTLYIHFPPYQIAPYAAGPITTPILFSSFKKLNTELLTFLK